MEAESSNENQLVNRNVNSTNSLEKQSDIGSGYLSQDQLSVTSTQDVNSPIFSPSSQHTLKTVPSTAETFLKEEKAILQDHLEIQVQVNQELKRMLLASLGEDLAYHYERLATEKAQLSMESEELKKIIRKNEEEVERLNISCDIWRSKFLASRVQCDEVYKTNAVKERQFRDLGMAVQGLLQEHKIRTGNLEHISENLTELKEKLHGPVSKASDAPKTASKQELSSHCVELTNDVICHLLGKEAVKYRPEKSAFEYGKYLMSWNRITGTSGKPDSLEGNKFSERPQMTPAEKYVEQLLQERNDPTCSNVQDSGLQNIQTNGVTGRFHLNANFEKITINCCKHCQGEMTVV